MTRRLLTARRRILAAVRVTRPLRLAVLNGIYEAMIQDGRLIQVLDFLHRLGLDDDTVRSLRSWFGRYAAEAWRAEHGTEPVRAWAIVDDCTPCRVAFYAPDSPVFGQAFASYKRLRAMNLRFDLVA